MTAMYRIMIGLSFAIGITTAAIALKKRGVPGNIIAYSAVLEIMLSMYLALVTAYILSGAENYGLNGSGGAFGILLGAFIFSKITPKYKDAIYSAYVIILPLMYGIGKIGCSFAGCCGGIKLNGGKAFPIQIVEAIVFLAVFAASAFAFFKEKYEPVTAAIIYAAVKIVLDFFRDTHEEHLITTNQVMCVVIIALLLGVKFISYKAAFFKHN